MITTQSLRELWQTEQPAVLCHPTQMELAAHAAAALSWRLQRDVVVFVASYVSPTAIHLFDPGERMKAEVNFAQLQQLLEEFDAYESRVRGTGQDHSAEHQQSRREGRPPEGDGADVDTGHRT